MSDEQKSTAGQKDRGITKREANSLERKVQKEIAALERRIVTVEERQDIVQDVLSRLAAVKSWWPEMRNRLGWK